MTLTIIQAVEDSNMLLKAATKTIKNETKEQKEGFLGILLRNILTGIVTAGYGKKKFESWLWKWNELLMPPRPLTNF